MSDQAIRKSIELLKKLPRVCLGNIKPLKGTLKNKRVCRGKAAFSKQSKAWHTDGRQMFPVGVTSIDKNPFYMVNPKEDYYKNFFLRKQYYPVSLLSLQRMIDLGLLDPTKTIDFTDLCNTKIINIDPDKNFYGINLVDEGCDIFQSKINIEVQYADELSIAAIEKQGGIISTKYYNKECVEAMENPPRFFERGVPIPRCKLPTSDIADYYCDPSNRGYLASENELSDARIKTCQKFGYLLENYHLNYTQNKKELELDDKDYIKKICLKNINQNDEINKLMKLKKGVRQIWYGLQPGWIVDFVSKCILKPTDEQLKMYYNKE
ncbi:39S ribosomal protein L15, mitochondrial [Intoshia linei]|uniref:Large ribosomal subunit protein uL15m n=1 Tax=Intoshia linei TaxID=1819745 RepID=A0A177B5V8_9BILA|nr:39S ribosomal protein L15, mitochondrial [Intoshia linei]